jgi:nitrate/nitrite-specific signal transduction histidine kinase
MRGHFGIDIMAERAQSIGGRLDVKSIPLIGTEVTIVVPAGDTETPSIQTA